ncbi:MAG: quinolinate synthase NadA, partial [Planctomycetes bacterium]|nr:quinolinate synthase NadA [Planctomycetota bacterium]
MTDRERDADRAIRAAKARLGSRLVILGHHYQRDEVVAIADHRGDSLELARLAASVAEAELVIFCGVRFMAETADIVTRPEVEVRLAAPAAGCPMADMADIEDVERAWGAIEAAVGPGGAIPVAYVNSSAAVKAFCGEAGGIICTSANAPAILRWALDRAPRVLFLPDQHLGRNTALALGVPEERIRMWRRRETRGGLSSADVDAARILLWDGFCHVHTHFTVEQVEEARRRYPGARVIVHPECVRAVVDAADASASTSGIIRAVSSASPGATFVIGTEIQLVARIGREYADRTIVPLSRSLCP